MPLPPPHRLTHRSLGPCSLHLPSTITHMAPELLLAGRVSKASDVYAFAILVWELYTGAHAYAGMPRALLVRFDRGLTGVG